MSRNIIMTIVALLITGLMIVPSMANSPEWEAGEKGPSGQAGKSNIGHLYLYEKAPISESEEDRAKPWLIVEDGMWGKMKYNLLGPTFDFVFNGHGLEVDAAYTLIYYPDPWPGTGLICLGSGIVTECVDDDCVGDGGNIHIAGSVDTGNLPIESDENDGAKIFLVPFDDVDCDGHEMRGWTGDDANLYEGALITFTDTDGVTDMANSPKWEAGEKGPSGQAGKSNIAHLYLYEKTSAVTDTDGNWAIVEDGMWGKMKYNLSGPTFNFVFNGHGLPEAEEYSLIYYPDPWPGKGLKILGSGIVTECVDDECVGDGGNIHIAGSVDTGDLPTPIEDVDANYPDGAKIFLVPTAHINSELLEMSNWAEELNLYEGALITFDDTGEDANALPGFDKTYYLVEKLAALQASDPSWEDKTVDDLEDLLNSLGFTPQAHYSQWGYLEGLSPNEYFNHSEYINAKAKAMYNSSKYSSVKEAKAAFKEAWKGDAYLHCLAYGAVEGINPSNSFDESEYLAKKLASIQANDPEWSGKTVDDLRNLLALLGMTALDHYLTYGQYEGLRASPVPANERVEE